MTNSLQYKQKLSNQNCLDHAMNYDRYVRIAVYHMVVCKEKFVSWS